MGPERASESETEADTLNISDNRACTMNIGSMPRAPPTEHDNKIVFMLIRYLHWPPGKKWLGNAQN